MEKSCDLESGFGGLGVEFVANHAGIVYICSSGHVRGEEYHSPLEDIIGVLVANCYGGDESEKECLYCNLVG